MNSMKFYLLPIFFIFTMLWSWTVNAENYITMDVDSSVRSGTYKCPSVKDCIMLVRYAEERGAAQYCNNAVIKRNGKIVWAKNFWPKRTPDEYKAYTHGWK